MPTTDTFIIPPMQPAEEQKKENKTKKKSGSNKTILLVGLVLLIITLPVAIYFITQRQQLADTRSKAAGCQCFPNEVSCDSAGMNSTSGSCSLGTKTGHCCLSKITDQIVVTTTKPKPTSTPTTKPASGGGTGGGTSGGTPAGRTATNSFAGCGYLEKPPLSGLKPCDSSTCGGDCGVFTYDCGQWCFDKACGGSGCQAIAAKDAADAAAAAAAATPEPTAPPSPTAVPTAAPTSAPNSSLCDASCTTDSNCASGLTCSSVDGINRCRNASCPAESTCTCPGATNTPAPTTATTTTTSSNDTTGQAMPTSGVGPGIIGSITVIGSVFLLLIGLAL